MFTIHEVKKEIMLFHWCFGLSHITSQGTQTVTVPQSLFAFKVLFQKSLTFCVVSARPLRMSQIPWAIPNSAKHLHSVDWTESLPTTAEAQLACSNLMHQTLLTSQNIGETSFIYMNLIIFSTSALLSNIIFFLNGKKILQRKLTYLAPSKRPHTLIIFEVSQCILKSFQVSSSDTSSIFKSL